MSTRLSKPKITAQALLLVNDVGIDGLSMRKLGAALQVQQGALYYYIASKQALLALMANEIALRVLQAFDVSPPSQPLDRTKHYAQALRKTIREQRDGARLIAYSPLANSPAASVIVQRLVTSLEECGAAATKTHQVADTILSYITGYALQEQQLYEIDVATIDDATFEISLDIILRGSGIIH